MVTRTTKAKTKATVTDVPFVETPQAQPEAAGPTFFEALRADLGITSVGWKRCAIGAVASMLTTGVLGYFAGHLIAYMTLAAAMLSGSMFIAALVYVLGMVAVFYAGYRVGPIVYLAVIDGAVDRAAGSAWSKVSGLFTSTPTGATA